MNCSSYPECGGCTLLELNAEEELAWKQNFIENLLKLHEIPAHLGESFQVPLHSRRRASLSAKRTKKTIQVGFMAEKSHNIVPINECLIVKSEILDFLPFIEQIGKIVLSRSQIGKFHITQCENGFDLELENCKPIDRQARASIALAAQGYAIRRITQNDETIYFDEAPYVLMANLPIHIPPHGFLQASAEAEDYMRSMVNKILSPSKNIADLFSGIGTMGYGSQAAIAAYEGDKKLHNIHKENINRNQIHNMKAYNRDLFTNPLTEKELNAYDGIIIDPPRAGAQSQFQEIANASIKNIAAISCEPKTFMRDAKILINSGYQIKRLQIIDQFRYSQHIELFAHFQKFS